MASIALVTGATRGIGAAIAARLLEAGHFVIGTATSDAGAAQIQAALGERGQGVVLNVTDAAAWLRRPRSPRPKRWTSHVKY